MPNADGTISLRGDESHPANLGRLCSKGSALGETLDLEGRLLHPTVHGKRVGWNDAINTVAGRFLEIIDQHGPDAVGFYVSGQLLTVYYYLAKMVLMGFFVWAIIYTNSRI